MYEYIKGIYVEMNKDYIVIENSDIGYKIFTSGSTMANMPKIGEKVLIYTQQIVREDFIGLYGFLTKDELNLFNLLLTINGVGAKATLSLLSISSADNLKYAIFSGNEKALTRASGIGKKIAQRIILELKDKIKIGDCDLNEIVDINGEVVNIENNNIKEAMEALVSLGYTEREAEKALNMVDKNQSVEVIIKNSLKQLMK